MNLSCLETEADHIEDWHRWRAGGIGASECAAAIGISPYADATPYALYCRKVGLAPPVEENDAMAIGTLMEPVLSALYTRRTGVPIVRHQVCMTSLTHPFLRATVDGVTADRKVVEFKTAGERMAEQWGEPGTDEIPEHYLCQVQQQLYVSGRPTADVAVLIGGNDFRVYTVDADPDLHAMLVPKLAEFWDRVERREPPEPTEPDWDLVARLRPRIQATIELPGEYAADLDAYQDFGRTITGLEADRKRLKARLILAMDDHACASLPDGRTIVRKMVDVKEYSVPPKSYPSFRITTPKGGN